MITDNALRIFSPFFTIKPQSSPHRVLRWTIRIDTLLETLSYEEPRWVECWWVADFLTYPTPLLESLCLWSFKSGEQPTFPDAPILKRLVTTGYYLHIGTNVPLPCIESADISEGPSDGNCYCYSGRLSNNLLRRVLEVRSLNVLVLNGWLSSFWDNEPPFRFPQLDRPEVRRRYQPPLLEVTDASSQ